VCRPEGREGRRYGRWEFGVRGGPLFPREKSLTWQPPGGEEVGMSFPEGGFFPGRGSSSGRKNKKSRVTAKSIFLKGRGTFSSLIEKSHFPNS